MELCQPGGCGRPLPSVAAGLRVLLAEYLGGVLVLAEALVLVLAAPIQDLEVETVRSAAALRPPSARGLKCQKKE